MSRLVVTGGFLGAGKTTWLLQAAQRLAARGYRVGYMSNDQGEMLVDTDMATLARIPVVEIAGGCFCCRYPELLTALQTLQAQVSPDVILAEPVGSCTDLMATVIKPLLVQADRELDIAPLSVMLDASAGTDQFEAPVQYLQDKQLEEANLLLLSKADQASAAQQAACRAYLQACWPHKPVYTVSGVSGQGLDHWLDLVLGQECTDPQSLVIDYELYARAEATLGWLNARGHMRADAPLSPTAWVQALAQYMADRLDQAGQMAHLKILARDGQLAVKGSQVRGTWTWDLRPAAGCRTQAWEFIVNLRACVPPAELEHLLHQGLDRTRRDSRARYYVTHLEAFAPLAPQPVHRMP